MSSYTVTEPNAQWKNDNPGQRALLVSWNLTAAMETGNAYCTALFKPVSVQYEGTWDSATLVLAGSNDETNFVTLQDGLGNGISVTDDGFDDIGQHPAYVRPSISNGSGSEDINVTMLVIRR